MLLKRRHSVERAVEVEDENDFVDAFGAGALSQEQGPTDDENSVQDKHMTIRAFLIGTLLAIFGSLLAQIYTFKPQQNPVSTMVLIIISYALGKAWETVHIKFTKDGPEGKRFTLKEHAILIIIASSASSSALATDLIAALDLYYNRPLEWYHAILLLFSSQLIGYGVAGLLQSILVDSEETIYPNILTTVTLFKSLHATSKSSEDSGKLRLFSGLACIMFVYQWFPSYISPTLTGISIFCLLAPKLAPIMGGPSSVTLFFGGTRNNEGLGLFSLCLDWNLITNACLTYPWSTQISMMIGIGIGSVLMPYLYYKNTWDALSFPFLSQSLYLKNGTVYDQTQILNSDFELDPAKLAEYGEPYFSGTWVYFLICNNLAVSAGLSHIFLYYNSTIKSSLFTTKKSTVSKTWSVPKTYYIFLLITSIPLSLYVTHASKSTLSPSSFILSISISFLTTLILGFMLAITGFQLQLQNILQIIGGLVCAGKPIACLYFTLYASTTTQQAVSMLSDLKLGTYLALSPRLVFKCQVWGTLLGGVCNYLMTTSIIHTQRSVLLNGGNGQWSVYMIESFNSLSVTFGALFYLFDPWRGRYGVVVWCIPVGLLLPVPLWVLNKWMPGRGLGLINVSVVCFFLANLCNGVNSSIMSLFAIGACAQWYCRTRMPWLFKRYNYIIAAGLDCGVQGAVFIINMCVLGSVAKPVAFPTWALNPDSLNSDYCPEE